MLGSNRNFTLLIAIVVIVQLIFFGYFRNDSGVTSQLELIQLKLDSLTDFVKNSTKKDGDNQLHALKVQLDSISNLLLEAKEDRENAAVAAKEEKEKAASAAKEDKDKAAAAAESGASLLKEQLGNIEQLVKNPPKDTSGLDSITTQLGRIEELLKNAPSKSETTDNSAALTKKKITETHPEIMKYRYTAADPVLVDGVSLVTNFSLNVAWINDDGHKFWGWNTPDMLKYIFTKIGGEDLVRDIFKSVLGGTRKPKLVLDVGSNVGYFSLLAASLNTPRVYAFDPQRQCAERLAWTAQANGFADRVVAINAFVAKEEGKTGKFPINTCGGAFTVAADYSHVEKEILAEVTSVNLATQFLNDPDDIDLVKVDVEGAELMVLEGSHELFVKHRIRNLVIELTPGWWKPRFGVAYEDGAKIVKQTLVDTGYKIWLLPLHSSQGKARLLDGWEELHKVLTPVGDFHNQLNYLFTLDDVTM